MKHMNCQQFCFRSTAWKLVPFTVLDWQVASGCGIQRTGWSKAHILMAFQCTVLFPVLARMSDIHFLLPSALDLCILYIFVYQWNVLSDMTLLRACFGPFSLHGLCFPVVCKKSMDRKYDTDGTSCWWLSLGSKVADYSWPIHAVFWCLLESGVPSWSLSWFVRLDRADRRFLWPKNEETRVLPSRVSEGTVSPTPSGARVGAAQLDNL